MLRIAQGSARWTLAVGLLGLSLTFPVRAHGFSPYQISPDQETASPRIALEELISEGSRASKAGDPKLALARFGEAVPIAEQLGDEQLLGSALSGLGWGQWAIGQYDAALETRRRALEIFRKRGDAARQTVLLRGIGETFYSLGRYEEALEQYRLALETSRLAPAPIEEGTILSDIGSAYRSQGRFAEAAEVLERALAILRPTGDRPALAQALTFLGIVNRATSDFDRALAYYEDALAIRRDTGDRRGESQVLGNMANVFLDLGQYERAIELNRQSLTVAQAIGYTAQVGFAQQNIGAALSRVPRPAEALTYYESALDTFRRIGRKAQIPWTLHSMGALHGILLRDEERGRAILLEALDAAKANDDREAEGYVLHDLGNIEMLAGRATAAMERFDAALKISSDMRILDLQYQVLANRGIAAARIGRTAAGLEDLRASAAIVNDLRANVASDQAKIAYIDTRQSVFHDLATVLGEAGRSDESLEAAEAGRARAFADLLNQRQIRGRAAEHEPMAALRAALSTKQQSTPSLPRGPGASGTRGADRVDVALDRVRAQNQELASLLTVASPTATEIKTIAARLDATIVEYLVTERALLAWVVPPAGGIQHVQTPTTAAHLQRLVQTLRRGLDAPSLIDLRHADRLDPQLRELHELLIVPISRWLPPASSRKTIVIVPHAATALVPFAALEDARGVPLVERFTLAMAPAIAIFRYTPAKRHAGPVRGADALIVVDPVPPAESKLDRLPGTREEGRRVARRLGAAAVLLAGVSASEAAVKTAVGGRRILHFATHGLVSSVRPVASSLVLGEGNGEDGYLRVDEIFGLDLAADLVVLSGCSTGLGRLTGDGIFGLTRAFIYAGTPSVVVSNWDVSDQATAVLFDHFYAGLARGLSKAHSLAAAQRATRRQFPHPAVWAAFVLAGEPR